MKTKTLGNWMTGIGLTSIVLGAFAVRKQFFGLSLLALALGFFCLIIALMAYMKPEPVDEWEKDEYDYAAEKQHQNLRSERRAKARRRNFKVIK